MRFWDSSAIVPLLIEQPATSRVEAVIDEVPAIVLWWGTPLECASAFARLRRERVISSEDESRLQSVLEDLRESCVEIQPAESTRAIARRLVRTHPLRAAEALQLAAAIEWAAAPAGHVIVTLDDRLADAARLEGFDILPKPS